MSYGTGFAQPQPAPNDFIRNFHYFGNSGMFLAGISMYTAGSAFAQLAALGLGSIIGLPLAALPIIGFWLIYAASKTPSYPEKSLTALTLFKVSVIIGLVVSALGVLALLIGALLLFGLWAGGAFLMLIGAGVGGAVLFLYYKAILQCLGAIRAGLEGSHRGGLPGFSTMRVLLFIVIGFSMLGSLMALAAHGFVSRLMSDIMFGDVLAGMLFGSPLYAFMSLAGDVGVILCIVVLGNFNDVLSGAGGPRPAAGWHDPGAQGFAPPPQPAPAFCTKCGAAFPDGTAFCTACGTRGPGA